MSWTAPRTWTAGETVTSAIMNTHIRDNLNFLKREENQVLGVGFSSGAANVGSGETDASGFNYVIPANFLSDGESIEWVGYFVIAANANTKTIKFYPDSTQVVTLWSGTANNKQAHFRFVMTRRSASTAGLQSQVAIAPASSGSVNLVHAVEAAISSLDFTALQTSKFTLQGLVSNDLILKELSVRPWRGGGTIV